MQSNWTDQVLWTPLQRVFFVITPAIINMYTNPKIPTEIYSNFLSGIETSEAIDILKLIDENQELRKTVQSLKEEIAKLETKKKRR